MARLHIDLHYIPSDLVPLALEMLIDEGLITRSEKDVRYQDLRTCKSHYPSCGGAFIEVTSFY